MRNRIVLLLMTLALTGAMMTYAQPPATRPAEIAITDVDGVMRHPLDLGPSKAVVILFISTECPICNGYAPEINRICKAYEPRGVAFYLVNVEGELKDADAKKHAIDFGYTCPVLVDRRHELVRKLGATVTPEVAVIAPDGSPAYCGRIDDLYAGLGKRRFAATTHELRDALDAVLVGKAVGTPRTAAVGCAIPDR